MIHPQTIKHRAPHPRLVRVHVGELTGSTRCSADNIADLAELMGCSYNIYTGGIE